MRTATRLLSALFALSLLAAACGSDSDDAAATDDGTTGSEDPFGTATWVLTAATIDGDDVDLLDSHPVTITVNGANVNGTAACNSYSGALANDGDVVFGDFAVTEMACDPPAAMELEGVYLGALGTITTAELDGDTLVLTSETAELRFGEEEPMADADLVDTDWMLESLVDGDAVSSVIADMEIDLLLEGGGAISGTDGCNRFNGTYTLDGDSLEVGPLAQTRMACSEEINAQAALIVSVLSQPTTVTISGDSLELTAADGSGLVYRAS